MAQGEVNVDLVELREVDPEDKNLAPRGKVDLEVVLADGAEGKIVLPEVVVDVRVEGESASVDIALLVGKAVVAVRVENHPPDEEGAQVVEKDVV